MYKTQLNEVQIPGKTEMSEVDLIIHILDSLPEEYEVAVSMLKGYLMDTMAHALGIKTAREKITLHHNPIKQHEHN